jgi:hypothetical protein
MHRWALLSESREFRMLRGRNLGEPKDLRVPRQSYGIFASGQSSERNGDAGRPSALYRLQSGLSAQA